MLPVDHDRVGAGARGRYRARTVSLSPGDVVVIYTDGVPEAAGRAGCGVLLKKALASGHAAATVEDNLRFALASPAVSSVIVGTINPAHLRANVAAANAVLKT